MTYVKSNYSTSSWGRLKYIFDDPAHDGSEHRVLAVVGNNLKLWGSNGIIYPNQSGFYLNKQFQNVRKKARNKNKRHEAQHLILSFSEKEFSTNDPKKIEKESEQINVLVTKFMNQRFPNTQWVSAVQCDGTGHKLHAHVLINPVKSNGRCIQTNRFSVDKLRCQWNKSMNQNYLPVTGHIYQLAFKKDQSGEVVKPLGWQDKLQQTLEWARQTAKDVEEYLKLLNTKNITVAKRNKKGDWSYHIEVNGKKKTVRDFYQRIDKKTGLVKSTRGLGKDYTPLSLTKYFKNKAVNKGTNKDYDKNKFKRSNRSIEQLARESNRRRERQLIERFISGRKQHEEDSRRTSNKTRSSKSRTRLDGKD